jgi:hypothetical protein
MVRITAVRFGEVEIDGKTYFSDMVVWWDGKFEYRSKSHEFGMSDFLEFAEKKPEIIVIGIGMNKMCRVLDEVRQAAEDKKIEIYQELSPKAAKMFNGFLADGKKAVALIHCTA